MPVNPWAVKNNPAPNPKAINNMIDQTPGQSNYDYYRGKSFDPGYSSYAENVGNMGTSLIGSNVNPFAGGLNAGTIAKFRNMFGYDSYPDINNPNTISTTRKWMDNLSGGQNALLDQYSKKMANAGVAASRGGMGVQGGADPYAQIRQQQMGTLAGQYSNNFNQAIEYQRQKALYDQGNANTLANLYGNIYSTNMNTGRDLLNMQLQGLGKNSDAMLQWQQMGEGAWNRDVDWNRNADQRELALQRQKLDNSRADRENWQSDFDYRSKLDNENKLMNERKYWLSRPDLDAKSEYPRALDNAMRYGTWDSQRWGKMVNPWTVSENRNSQNSNSYQRQDQYSLSGRL